MLPDNLVRGYEIVNSYSELQDNLTDNEISRVAVGLGVDPDTMNSVEWRNYFWSVGYLIYPDNLSEITKSSNNVFMVVEVECGNEDDMIEVVVGESNEGRTVSIYGPNKSISPVKFISHDSLIEIVRRSVDLLKFIVYVSEYLNESVLNQVREGINGYIQGFIEWY